MRAWLGYAATALVVTAMGAAVVAVLVEGGAVVGVWSGAGLALVLQLVAFALLLRVREDPKLFLVGWLSGLLLRFGAVGVVAILLTRRPVLPAAPTLLSLTGFVFVLLLLEPVFLRRGLQTR